MDKKRVLISVSDKTGIVEFARELSMLDYEIISTGGTKKTLDDAGIKTIGISEYTGFPEILGGRVKTLHPAVHGGLLAVRDNEMHIDEMKKNNLKYIDMVIVNLYPFKQTVKKGCEFAEAIENIDIGGPSMLRSSAKNHRFVTTVVDSNDYSLVLSELKQFGDTTLETRGKLAAKVFRHTASYDAAIAKYLTEQVGETNPESLTISYDLKQNLRYGENPHQSAAFYKGEDKGYSLAYGTQIQGKELSYNNIQDANAAINILKDFEEPVVVALKHMNPCGVGIGANIKEAWTKAYEADPVSIFGGIVATNVEVTKEVAELMKPIFLEIVIAPSYSKEALEVLSAKKNLRVMEVMMGDVNPEMQLTSVNGGLIVQNSDNKIFNIEDFKVVTKTNITQEQMNDLVFAMKVCKYVKSNAIVVAANGKTCGIGCGQTNRVGAAKLALEWAKEHNMLENLVLASDAFFPFSDTVELAKQYGVKAIIQPGGSIRDEDSIKACDEAGIAMVFTGMRHFKH